MEQDEEIIVEADPAPSHVRGSERNPPSTSTAELGSDHYVSLADRLNPNRKGFDAEFKAKWGEMSKPQKAAVVKKDKQVRPLGLGLGCQSAVQLASLPCTLLVL